MVDNNVGGNIGEGWYRFGLIKMLEKHFPEHTIYEGSGGMDLAFKIHSDTRKKNMLNLREYESADLHILAGPILGHFTQGWTDTIQKWHDRGEKYALVSISGTNLSRQKVADLSAFFEKYPPLFMATRDTQTYSIFKEYVPYIYDGICTSWLVDLNYEVPILKMDRPYFISSFYTEEEPKYSLIDDNKSVDLENLNVVHRKNHFGLPYKYSRWFNCWNEQQDSLGGMKIVRTIQDIGMRFNRLNYAMPNSFVSYNLLHYLELAKSAEFTVSDRVHACAISLACGRPAWFLFETPRAGIYTRLGLDYHSNNGKLLPPDRDLLLYEQSKLVSYIKQFI